MFRHHQMEGGDNFLVEEEIAGQVETIAEAGEVQVIEPEVVILARRPIRPPQPQRQLMDQEINDELERMRRSYDECKCCCIKCTTKQAVCCAFCCAASIIVAALI